MVFSSPLRGLVKQHYYPPPIRWKIVSGAPRAKRASGAPWVIESTHPRKFGNHVTDRPSFRTTGIPMFTLTLSSYFGSPRQSWLHINVVVYWQLSKQGILWQVSPDRIAGSGVDPSRSNMFWSYLLTMYSFSNDRRLSFFKFISNMLCLCHYRPALLRFWFQTDLRRKNSASFFKIQAGKTFSYHGHVLVTLHVQFLCSDWLKFDGWVHA